MTIVRIDKSHMLRERWGGADLTRVWSFADVNTVFDVIPPDWCDAVRFTSLSHVPYLPDGATDGWVRGAVRLVVARNRTAELVESEIASGFDQGVVVSADVCPLWLPITPRNALPIVLLGGFQMQNVADVSYLLSLEFWDTKCGAWERAKDLVT